MMQDAIKTFAKQFNYQPVIENAEHYQPKQKFLVCGMGGSHLSADILQSVKPDLDLLIHCDYGLPQYEITDRTIVISSYSGNTEEVIDGYVQAIERKLSVLVIAVGGRLIELAKANRTPYIQLPETGIQPRSALGFSLKALLCACDQAALLEQAQRLAVIIDPEKLEDEGKKIAESLSGKVPIVYASRSNAAIAYNWKIKFNETGKIPAFSNVVPELNHNEMTGFDVAQKTKMLSDRFHFIFLLDDRDHERIQKRFAILEQQYKSRGLAVSTFVLRGDSVFERIFTALVVADWAAVYIAAHYGLESEQVPMVEEFKKMIA